MANPHDTGGKRKPPPWEPTPEQLVEIFRQIKAMERGKRTRRGAFTYALNAALLAFANFHHRDDARAEVRVYGDASRLSPKDKDTLLKIVIAEQRKDVTGHIQAVYAEMDSTYQDEDGMPGDVFDGWVAWTFTLRSRLRDLFRRDAFAHPRNDAIEVGFPLDDALAKRILPAHVRRELAGSDAARRLELEAALRSGRGLPWDLRVVRDAIWIQWPPRYGGRHRRSPVAASDELLAKIHIRPPETIRKYAREGKHLIIRG